MMDNQFLAEEISKREYQVNSRDKMIRYIQQEHKKRGEEIVLLKDQLHRRNALVRKLRETNKELKKEKKENEAIKQALAEMQTIPDWQFSPLWFQEFQRRTIEIINR